MSGIRCPKCGKMGLQQRYSKKTGQPYLANVETYDSGISYFRSLHTREECEAFKAGIEADAAAEVALIEGMEAWRNEGLALRARAHAEGYTAEIEAAMNEHADRMPKRA